MNTKTPFKASVSAILVLSVMSIAPTSNAAISDCGQLQLDACLDTFDGLEPNGACPSYIPRPFQMHYMVGAAGSDIRDGPKVGQLEVNYPVLKTYTPTYGDNCQVTRQICVFQINDGTNSQVTVTKDLINAETLVTGTYRYLAILGDNGWCGPGIPAKGASLFLASVGSVTGIIDVNGISDGGIPIVNN